MQLGVLLQLGGAVLLVPAAQQGWSARCTEFCWKAAAHVPTLASDTKGFAATRQTQLQPLVSVDALRPSLA